MTKAYYVCAVARPRASRAAAPSSVEGIVPGTSVHTLLYRDLLAVISPVPLAEFGTEALEANLQDVDWTSDRVLAHHRILTTLLDGYTLIPFKFCTLFSSEDRVQDMMRRHYGVLDQALCRLEGAVEWGVKLYYDRERLMTWVQDKSEAFRPQREKITQAREGTAYFLRKKLQRAAEEEVERTAEICAEQSHRRLSECVREAVANSVQPAQIHRRPEEMILNGAYLVDESQLAAFWETLATLEATYADQGFQYELIGPWPPYNFTNLELELL